MTYTECEDVTGRWGDICPSCGKRLPSWNRNAHLARRAREREARNYLWHDAAVMRGTPS